MSDDPLLRMRATSMDPRVRAETASRPDIPADLVDVLLRDQNFSVRAALARNKAVPPARLVALVDDPALIVVLAVANRLTDVDALARLVDHPDEGVPAALLVNDALPGALVAQLAHRLGYTSWPVAYNIARHPNTPPRILAECARQAESADVRVIAVSAIADPRVLTELAADESSLVRAAVGDHRRTPPATLTALAADPQQLVRYAVARNRHTPVESLVALAADPEATARRRVAENPNTPVQVLVALADDAVADVRRGAVSNPNLPLDVALAHAGDRAPSVNTAILDRVDVTVLDTEPSPVRAMAARHLDAAEFPGPMQPLAHDDDPAVRAAVAANPAASTDLLDLLAADPDPAVRRSVAAHRSTPPEVLARLGEDPADRVRTAVAKNPGTLPDTLTALADDLLTSVRRAASAALLQRLAGS